MHACARVGASLVCMPRGCCSQRIVSKGECVLGDVHGLCGHGSVFPVHVLLCSMSTRVAASATLASEQNPDIRERFAGARIIAWLCLHENECECLECACGRECVRTLTSQYE